MTRKIISILAGLTTINMAVSAFEPLVYDRSYMDAITEEALWSRNEEAHTKQGPRGSPNHIVHIDSDFYDNYIVSRWTGQWLAGDTTWVVAFGRPVPWGEGYQFSLPARSAFVLCNNFYQERADVRFAIIDYDAQEDIKITLQSYGPTFTVLRDGIAHYSGVIQNNYVEMHQFLESELPDGKERFQTPVSGRITVAGKYLSYVRKEIKVGQEFIVANVQGWLTYNEAPELIFSAFEFYREQDAEMQMFMNVLILSYLLAMQYYFIRHMLCESCFSEWKQLNDDVDHSERTLDKKRELYAKEMARRKTALAAKQSDRVAAQAGRGAARKELPDDDVAEESKKTR